MRLSSSTVTASATVAMHAADLSSTIAKTLVGANARLPQRPWLALPPVFGDVIR